MPKAMHHLNDNLLCAVAIETTGPTAGFHDLWQVCVLPLDHNYKPVMTPLPFHTIMRPHEKDLFDPKFISQDNRIRAVGRGICPYKAGDVFGRWLEQFNLKEGKKIMPLTYDWADVRPFLQSWLTPDYFHLYFHRWYRDLLASSLHSNDAAEDSIEQVPYPKNNLSFVCHRLGVEYRETNTDCLMAAVAIAEAYKKSLRRLF